MSDQRKLRFAVNSKQQVDMKVRLIYDGLYQTDFMFAVITAYLEEDPRMISIIQDYQAKAGIFGTKQRKKMRLDQKKALENMEIFALDQAEINEIFDILEEEDDW